MAAYSAHGRERLAWWFLNPAAHALWSPMIRTDGRMHASSARTVSGTLMAVALSFATTWAAANKPPNLTEGEMALLPAYCPDAQGFKYGDQYYNTSPRAPHWVSLMGQGFWAVHHYCWALVNMRRAKSISTRSPLRVGTLEGVRADFVYVFENTKPNFVLLPEIYTRMGEVELLLGNVGGAHEAYGRARQLKPDYWPAYSEWAEFLIKTNQKAAAKQLIETGLSLAPDSKTLADLYRSLGGDPSSVQPVVLTPPRAAASAPQSSSE